MRWRKIVPFSAITSGVRAFAGSSSGNSTTSESTHQHQHFGKERQLTLRPLNNCRDNVVLAVRLEILSVTSNKGLECCGIQSLEAETRSWCRDANGPVLDAEVIF